MPTCRSCFNENPDSSKFCGSCGQKVLAVDEFFNPNEITLEIFERSLVYAGFEIDEKHDDYGWANHENLCKYRFRIFEKQRVLLLTTYFRIAKGTQYTDAIKAANNVNMGSMFFVTYVLQESDDPEDLTLVGDLQIQLQTQTSFQDVTRIINEAESDWIHAISNTPMEAMLN